MEDITKERSKAALLHYISVIAGEGSKNAIHFQDNEYYVIFVDGKRTERILYKLQSKKVEKYSNKGTSTAYREKGVVKLFLLIFL